MKISKGNYAYKIGQDTTAYISNHRGGWLLKFINSDGEEIRTNCDKIFLTKRLAFREAYNFWGIKA